MNSAVSEPVLIGIDWGTSSLRAFLIGAGGEVLDSVSSPEGIMHVPDGDFEAVFANLVGQWMTKARLPVLASGMITSRNGWVETPYETVPLGADDLARALVPHRTACGVELSFITGVTTEHESGPDVMRGEETQIIGASALGMSDGVFVMPGTHSKWIRVVDGRIEDYATYMTGEIFSALRGHTILGALIEDGPFSAEGFKQGVTAGLKERSSLLHDLFHVRTLPLMGKIAPTMVADYLSGLLIGAEISAGADRGNKDGRVTIIGRNDLADRYETALGIAGVDSRRAPDDIVAMGHFLIARSAGLLL
ncbi:MAG: 2-dehydro-3-deoxygalactonokinase [Roseitalea sp.]|jgi:2-dehydro-3-deoxygalactonokinase|uniref:2-dehydro-3-deoxygalactonokinase n=1 Tax=Oceaniradius stylonematis TaxID=2184161 RepID=UPI001B24073D|nr:2-dehydro-3-deoxygalactonokinase [Roseitalea sp.]MBO6951542.1 2-dehydro-3-deoxygalactonokinase [Rhizobiaceae bacterium]MBO6592612.1 2-dehydro-3-deoxygalactonokinase [Roseitalea sp.]MBO6598867.1 2-dehydro-3-deoxygalactonokinase [Roseitalea sp.]MBO6611313.1 2-dehydro-3-deoxygalactonokinase [Roseitalea sp.]